MNIQLTVHAMKFSIYTERQKSCTTFSFDFFRNKIDDFKNQCSLVFMHVQLTIVVENIKRVWNHAYIFMRKMKNRNFWA